MSLAFLTLLCAPSAQAQGGYPGGGGSGGPGSYPGYVGWVAQPVVVDGHKNTTTTDAQGHTTTSPVAFSTLGGFGSPGTFVVVPNTSATYTVSGTVTYTWKWQGGSNNMPPPTAPQYILKQGTTAAYSHHYWTDGGDPPSTMDIPFSNWITFTPNFEGVWHWKSWTNHNGDPCSAPDVVDPDIWSWSPNESEDGWDYGKVSMGYGQIEYVDGVAQGQPTGNQTYHVSYTATDNTDKASATANAKIALHDEWENKQNDSPATTGHSKKTCFYADGAKAAVRNDTSTKFTTAPTWTLTVNGSVTLGFKFSPPFDVGWAKVLGVEVNAAVTVGGSVGVSVPGPLLDPGYWIFPIVTTTWNTNNYLVDHYTVTGFEATYPESADDPNSVVEGGSWTNPTLIGQLPPE